MSHTWGRERVVRAFHATKQGSARASEANAQIAGGVVGYGHGITPMDAKDSRRRDDALSTHLPREELPVVDRAGDMIKYARRERPSTLPSEHG